MRLTIVAVFVVVTLTGGSGGTHAAPAAPTLSQATSACSSASGRRLEVGPGKTYPTPRAAAAAASDGDVVLITAGEYRGDVATWPQNQLTICGSGGRARLFASGADAGGKGVWVIQGSDVVIEHIDFHDAKVPDRNGAGIRAEGKGLTVRDSGFYDNENGILGPNTGELTIERCEFARNGFGDGQSHNLYVGAVDRLIVRASWFHDAKIGHNLKSRAKETMVENSWFIDGPQSTTSYQIEAPNGGRVYLRGNVIHKGPKADNPNLIAYGAEGLVAGRTNSLTMIHNTLVSRYSGGNFVKLYHRDVSVAMTANLFAGTNHPRTISSAAASKIREAHNLVTTAAFFRIANDPAMPNFWPVSSLAARTLLPDVPDLGYLSDAPAPFALRRVTGPRRVGALQAPP